MMNEFEAMNLLHHPKLARLVDAYDARDEMTLISELCTGGELLETVTSEKYITEIEVRYDYCKPYLKNAMRFSRRLCTLRGLSLHPIHIIRH